MPQRLKPDSTSESNDLRNAGLKVTLPRLKILDILADGSARHMSAEDIYKKLLVSNEDIGLATVYRVLTQFEAAGLVTRHHFEGGMAVFELNQGAHHDHIVCVDCGKVEEFMDVRDRRAPARRGEAPGVRDQRPRVDFIWALPQAQLPQPETRQSPVLMGLPVLMRLLGFVS